MSKAEFFKEKAPLIIAYVSIKDLAKVTVEDAKAIDIINIAFAHIENASCVFAAEAGELRNNLKRLRQLNPDIKFVLSVGGWSAGGFSEVASQASTRKEFSKSAADLLKDYDIDGIDIDWEYPGISMAGIKSAPEDKENFTLFLASLRETLDSLEEELQREYSLSIAGGGDAYFCRNTEMAKLAKICDYIQIMTYDLRGGYTHATGHHTNLYTPLNDFSNVSVDTAVKAYHEAGVPKEKLVIGAAFYSRLWKGVPAGTKGFDHGYNQMAETVGGYGPSYDDLVDKYINKNGFTRYYDEVAKAPYLYDGETFISYDDPQSIQAKVKYLQEEKLLGIMYWEYALAYRHSLTKVIQAAIEAEGYEK